MPTEQYILNSSPVSFGRSRKKTKRSFPIFDINSSCFSYFSSAKLWISTSDNNLQGLTSQWRDDEDEDDNRTRARALLWFLVSLEKWYLIAPDPVVLELRPPFFPAIQHFTTCKETRYMEFSHLHDTQKQLSNGLDPQSVLIIWELFSPNIIHHTTTTKVVYIWTPTSYT